MKISSLAGNKLLYSLIITVGILITVLWFSIVFPFSSILHYSNLGIRNILFSLDIPGKHTRVHPSLTLVTIDNKTLSDPASGGLGRWQDFNRTNYARVIDNLSQAGAIVIGFDILFSEKAIGDETLAASMKKSGNVVLGLSFERSGNEENLLLPVKTLADAASSVWYFQPKLDTINQMVYGFVPNIKSSSGLVYDPFSLAVLRKYLDSLGGGATEPAKDAYRYLGFAQFHTGTNEFLPLARADKNEVLINYASRGAGFRTLSFVDVYNNAFDPAAVRDKIVVVGTTATALPDIFNTPLGIMYGVVVHLNFINTVLEGNYLTYVSPFTEYIVIVLLTLFLTIFLMHVENRVYQLIYSFIALTIGAFFYLLVFGVSSKILSNPTEIIIIVVLIAICVTAYKYIYEEKWKRLLKNTLSQYLAEDLVTSVLSNYEEVKLGGTKKEVTLFFSDIAGFTTLSERMEPEELVGFLSIYLKEVSDIIIHERGFVNKYEGDAVMAIWGAFVLENRQSYLACKAALLQQAGIARINEKFKSEYGFEISVRMGLNKGLAVVGNIGSAGKKIEYTALGDTVNTASRFEGINKMYDTLIICGESIARDEREHFIFRKIDSVMVKGKDKPVLLYELVGHREQVTQEVLSKIARYETAFGLYQSKEFKFAADEFRRLIAEYQDGPSTTLLERAETYIKNGCPDDWQGHYRATEK
jgi:adenylate cyclase